MPEIVISDAEAPSLASALTYLGDGAWTDEQVAQALEAEANAQARLCTIPEPWPADLAHALYRRVHRNLAMRNVPLGVQSDGEGGGIRVGGTDPEVRRLEAPYRKRVLG